MSYMRFISCLGSKWHVLDHPNFSQHQLSTVLCGPTYSTQYDVVLALVVQLKLILIRLGILVKSRGFNIQWIEEVNILR